MQEYREGYVRDIYGIGVVVGIGRRGGGLSRNITTKGENTRREWRYVHKMTNGLRLCLPLRRVYEKVSGLLTPVYRSCRW